MQRLLITLLCLGLAACGFQLRGSWALPYESLYLDIPAESEFGAQLSRTLRGTQATRVVATPGEAEAIFRPTGEGREKKVVSFSSGGRVREVQLIFRYGFHVRSQAGEDIVPPTTIAISRDVSYDDAKTLAKEQEEEFLWRDMTSDMVQQVMRRLAGSMKKKAPAAEVPQLDKATP